MPLRNPFFIVLRRSHFDKKPQRTVAVDVLLAAAKTAGDQQHELVIRETVEDQDESSSMPGSGETVDMF